MEAARGTVGLTRAVVVQEMRPERRAGADTQCSVDVAVASHHRKTKGWGKDVKVVEWVCYSSGVQMRVCHTEGRAPRLAVVMLGIRSTIVACCTSRLVLYFRYKSSPRLAYPGLLAVLRDTA
jgi:hypothetical protein